MAFTGLVGLGPLVAVSGLEPVKWISTLARCPATTSTFRVLPGAFDAAIKTLWVPGERNTSAGGCPKSVPSIVSAASPRSLLTISVP